VEAVREYLERDVVRVEGRVGFHARVAARALATVERELTLGAVQLAAAVEARRELLDRDGGYRELEAELARQIRSGELDTRLAEVVPVVRDSVAAKLAVADPAYPTAGGPAGADAS
jgi:hypothetical protein